MKRGTGSVLTVGVAQRPFCLENWLGGRAAPSFEAIRLRRLQRSGSGPLSTRQAGLEAAVMFVTVGPRPARRLMGRSVDSSRAVWNARP